jgi:hypothetical protein
MSLTWGEARKGRAANALTQIEVDEVSLVDRPATGRRFVLFKRTGPLRAAREEDTNKCSATEAAGKDIAERLVDVEALQKRAEETFSRLARLQAMADSLEQRLAAVEKGRPARQSTEPEAGGRPRLWSGVL